MRVACRPSSVLPIGSNLMATPCHFPIDTLRFFLIPSKHCGGKYMVMQGKKTNFEA